MAVAVRPGWLCTRLNPVGPVIAGVPWSEQGARPGGVGNGLQYQVQILKLEPWPPPEVVRSNFVEKCDGPICHVFCKPVKREVN